ncbi:TIP120-domain-containing protein [Jaminaea rosea]|uniref:TIP120-domain-containing protein n=1 Tax=Jaminaea rosea TaxID=1569628 RepID=A0A316UWB5_9BASI|nr:TIP120-domain-containing protein [Jaminaea rosea]PWN28611.1 TIP120-domain-containing protein [Jaminaea rosea]
MGSRVSASEVNALLEKMKSQDADFRFMALNDLISDSKRDGSAPMIQMDQDLEGKVVAQILELMKDANGEVKNMAVKSLGVLVAGRLRDKQISIIIDNLVKFISSKEEDLRDIASLALKTVVGSLPAGSTPARLAFDSLSPKLLSAVGDGASSQELIIDSLDVLADLFLRFPRNLVENAGLQKAGLQSLLPLLGHSRVAVRKRATSALSTLAASSSSEVFTQLSSAISTDLSGTDTERIKTVVQLVGALARLSPRRLGRRLPDFMPRIVENAQKEDDDELRETCLQAMELVLLRCPTEITPFLNQLIDIGIQLIKHDPNFAGGNDSDDEMADGSDAGNDEDDDDLDLDDEYSDDDDVSWKVRRAAAKTLSAAIATRPELLASLVASVTPVLVSRFSEREESVRLEIFSTFLSLLRQVQLSAGLAQATEVRGQSPGALKRKRDTSRQTAQNDAATTAAATSPRSQLRTMSPTISKALIKELGGKSASTRLTCASAFRELAVVLQGGLDPSIPAIIAQLEKAIKTAGSAAGGVGSTSIKSEVISFLRVLFITHSPKAYEGQLATITEILASAITDQAHRDSVEALDASADLVAELSGTQSTVLPLYEATLSRLNRQDSDSEIKEKGIATLGALLAFAGSQLQNKYSECFPVLLERLRNEVTRFATVKVITLLAASQACTGAEFENFLQTCDDEVATLLRQSNRPLKLAAFDALAASLERLGSHLSSSTANSILTEIHALLLHDVDMTLLPYALKTVGLLVSSNPNNLSTARDAVFPRIMELVKSPLLQGTALESVVAFIRVVVAVDTKQGASTVKELLASYENGGAPASVARCIGAAVIADQSSVPKVLKDVGKQLGDANDATTAFNLLILGEVGRFEDFSKHEKLSEQVLAAFASESDEVRSAAAFALGNMGVGNLDAFLPVIRQHVESDDTKHRLLALNALKELITHGSPAQLASVAEQVWTPLLDICQINDEATRNIGAECLARLTLTDPQRYLVQLQSRLADPSASTRAAVIAAVRFTLTDASSTYDDLLAPFLLDFLTLLKDPDLEVRRHAMFALNSSAHNKPHLIREHLTTLLPLLYEETHVRKELMRKVAMGPFTVTQDDGLDLRKNAFETMYTLLDTCLAQIALPEYLARVIAGLRDDDQVKLLCYLILVRLADLVPLQMGQNLDEVSDPIGESLKIKLKDGATKQDVEKSTELTRAAFRALVALERLVSKDGAGGSGVVSAPRFQQLVREAATGPSAALYREVAAAASSQQRA